MHHRLPGALALLIVLAVWTAFAPAQDEPIAAATLKLLLPSGAKATLDGQMIEDPYSVPVTAFKSNEIRRVKLGVTFADGAKDERLIDVSAGQRYLVPVPHPGPEKAAIVSMQALVPINSAAISRDGRYIAVGLDDRSVVLWDTTIGRPVRSLLSHLKPVLSVAFTPDSKKLLSASSDTTAVLWDVETGAKLRTFKGHTAAISSVAFSPDGEQFLTGSQDGTAVLWKTATGEPIHTLKSKGILGVAYSPDGTMLGTSSSDRTSTLWDAATGKQTVLLRGHREDANCIAFSPDNKRVITGSSDDTSIIWDAASGKRISLAGRHTNNIHSVAFTPNGLRVISGEREELVMMWDAMKGAHVRTFSGHKAEIFSIVPSADGRTMLTASRDGTARLWDLATGQELLALTSDGARKTWAVVTPDGFLDGSETGRRALGYYFSKFPGGEADQFFAGGYRPGLLAEVWRGERPLPARPLGQNAAPLIKLVAPKERNSTTPTATISADLTDQGNGVDDVVLENNGVRLAIPAKSEPTPAGNSTRYTFTLPLAPGQNRIRVRATDRDHSRESASSEFELSRPRIPGQRGRMYVVAIGIGGYAEKRLHLNYPTKDVTGLSELLRTRGAKLFDRVDVVPILDRDATRATIEDTVKDVAELTRPQDTIMVLLFGHGARIGDRLYFAPYDCDTGKSRPKDTLPKQGVDVDDIVAAMGRASALNRALVIDVASSGEVFSGALKGRSEYSLRGAVERWGRSHGIHTLVALATTEKAIERREPGSGLLTGSLLDSATGEEVSVTDWFQAAADRTSSQLLKITGSPQDVQTSTRSKDFPLLSARK